MSKITRSVALVLAAVLLAGAEGCPMGEQPAAAAEHVLQVRAFAAPLSGYLDIIMEGTAISVDADGVPHPVPGMKDQFPWQDYARNPLVHTIRYSPGVVLSVLVTVTAPKEQTVVGCEIMDRGVVVAYKQLEVRLDKPGTTVICGPYTTAP